jgi:hypothetical protein
MKKAEKTIRSPRRQYEWSPTLGNAGTIRRYWSFRFREAKYDADYTQIINQLQERIQRSDPNFTFPHYLQEITLDEIRGHYTKASKQLRDIQNKSTEARLQSYQDLSLLPARTTMTPTQKPESNRS